MSSTTSALATNFANGLVPFDVAKKIGFYSIEEIIKRFQTVSLHEMIRVNSKTAFLANATKFCWRMTYDNLNLNAMQARDNFTDAIVPGHLDGYVKQQMHSISGEQNDLCMYTYGPDELIRFLESNKHNHYTFLPITVHATESANGIRHDMLVIFDNNTKQFYWFDGRNREDYLPFGKNIPRNAIDILFINLAETSKIGFSYEPAPSWQFHGVLHPYGSIGQLDFAFSTAWCYLTILMMDSFNSPMEFISMLDSLSEADRFHLLYNALLHMVGVFKYHESIPANASIDFTAEFVKLPNGQISEPVISTGISAPSVPVRKDNTQETVSQSAHGLLPGQVPPSTPVIQTSSVQLDFETKQPPRIANQTDAVVGSVNTNTDGLRQRVPYQAQQSEMQPILKQHDRSDLKPIPIIASTTRPKNTNENCAVM
jgi:hypothetical protein